MPDLHRVIALIPAYRKGDAIARLIERLVESGADIYFLDSRSAAAKAAGEAFEPTSDENTSHPGIMPVDAANQSSDLAAHVAALTSELAALITARESQRAAVVNLENVLAEAWRRADHASRRAAALEVDLAAARQELAMICHSKTWRWGEPIGRFIQTLGFGRRT